MKYFKMLLLASAVLLFTACGGGGGSSNNGGEAQKSMLTITDQNANRVMGASMLSIQGVQNLDNIFGSNSLSVVSRSMAKINKLGNIASKDQAVAPLAESGNETCSGGGTVSYNIDDNGGFYVFNNCVEDNIGLTLDGKATATINGNILNVEYTNFSLDSHYYNLSVYYQNVKVTIDQSNYNMNGSITGYVNSDGNKIEYDQYIFSKTGNKYLYNGFVKTNCMGNWIELKTVKTLELSDYGYGCPTAGEVIAIGNNSELKTVFNTDKSVNVYLNGEVYTTYSDCNELPSTCEGD